jgi:hypothetical protein
MNIVIEKTWDYREILEVFQDPEVNEDEEEDLDASEKDKLKKKYSLESQISSMACSQKELPDYMKV